MLHSSTPAGKVILLLLLALNIFILWDTLSKSSLPTKISLLPHRHNKLHLLLPASTPDPNLLKAFISAVVLGYPLPTIVNWSTDSDVTNNEDMKSPTRFASQMDFLFSVSQYLQSIKEFHEDDLVLVIDSLDTFFQLPANVLLSRYFAINKRANELMTMRFGEAVAANFTQSILFSAEKKCWPHSIDDVGCWATPESPLPKNLYGPLTDLKVKGVDDFQYMRPRYLNAGFTIGPVKKMQTLFQYAAGIAKKDPNIVGADQAIYAQILGEQEYMREAEKTVNEHHTESKRKRNKMIEFKTDEKRQYEFGIGLDYDRAMGYPTAHAEDDAKWVTFSKEESLEKTVQNSPIKVTEARIREGLQQDVQSLDSPFRHLDVYERDLLDVADKTWNDIPLFTDLWTGVTPATIHFNGKSEDGYKELREKGWAKMWFTPYLPELFNATIASFERSTQEQQLVAKLDVRDYYSTTSNDLIREKGFGALVIDKKGGESWLKWDDMCKKDLIHTVV